MVWDAVEGCEHVWGDNTSVEIINHSGGKGSTLTSGAGPEKRQAWQDGKSGKTAGQFCQLCGAWRGCLGLEPTPELFIQHMVQIFAEVKRVLRSDGTCWINMGSSYAGGGGSSGHTEETTNCGRKTANYGAVATGGRVAAGFKPKDLIPIPWMLAMALQADGWYLRSDIIWHKPNPMPESVTDRPTKSHEYIFLLTKSAKYFYDADAIREPSLPQSHERAKYPRASDNKGRPIGKDRDDGGMIYASGLNALENKLNPSGRNKRTVWTIATQPMPQAHFATFPEKLIEPCILAGTSAKGCCVECQSPWERVVEKGELKNISHCKTTPTGSQRGTKFKDEKVGSGWTMDGKFISGWQHESKTIGWQPTCKCNAETEPCVVMDIFGGAMTSAIVAHKHGRKFVMIELSEDYIDNIGIPRIKKATEQLKLF